VLDDEVGPRRRDARQHHLVERRAPQRFADRRHTLGCRARRVALQHGVMGGHDRFVELLHRGGRRREIGRVEVLVIGHQQLETRTDTAREQQRGVEGGLRLAAGLHQDQDVAESVHGHLPGRR
jgi:hypothetical protein